MARAYMRMGSGVVARWRWLVVLAGVVLAGLPDAAWATPVTFAQYTVKGTFAGNDTTFNQTGGGTGATFKTTDTVVGIPIDFRYHNLNFLPADLTGIQDAHLIIDLTTATHVVNAGGLLLIQKIDSGTIRLLRDTPAAEGGGARTDLLTATLNSVIYGSPNSSVATLTADTGAGNTVAFTSDFVDLSMTVTRSLSIALNSLTPSLAINGNFLRDFTASSNGSFSVEPPPTNLVPEPASLILLGLGLVGAPRIFRRAWARRNGA